MSEPSGEAPLDPTRVTSQPALQRASSRGWLIPATLMAALGTTMFAVFLSLRPIVAAIGIALTLALWVAMMIVAWRVSPPRRRNRILAWLMGGLALGILGLVFTVFVLESAP